MNETITFRSITGQEFTDNLDNACVVIIPEHVRVLGNQFDSIALKGVGQIAVCNKTANDVKTAKLANLSCNVSYTLEELDQQKQEFLSRQNLQQAQAQQEIATLKQPLRAVEETEVVEEVKE
jgi:hypothetical protein